MPWESIGSVDTGEMPHEKCWILFALELARNYVHFVCCDGPDDTVKLGIMWRDHDLGEYPSLGVWYEDEEPSAYIRACEDALDAFNQAVSWADLKEHFMRQEEDSDDEDDCISSIYLMDH